MPLRIALLGLLFFFSGLAALVYQVLWVRELGLLFGNTAQAAAITIAVFFAGLAAGGWFWGARAPRLRSALTGFALLEIGVGAAALGHLLLSDLYHALYPLLRAVAGEHVGADLLLRAGVATLILFPPAFLIGGTLPMMGQFLVRNGGRLGTTGSGLYAQNTFGAATGALAAGFVLPPALGLRGAYLLAIGIDVLVGLMALALAHHWPSAAPNRPEPRAAPSPRALRGDPGRLSPKLITAIALGSGFVTLGVEVLWTRLFAQVLQNSVYTYAIVLLAFLLALAIGAVAANGLARLRAPDPRWLLFGLLVVSALVIAASPWTFQLATDGLSYIGAGAGWIDYLAAVAGVVLLVMVLPGVIPGAVLPYLLRVVEADRREPGEVIGRLVAINTVGAIVGALVAGFLLLPGRGANAALLMLAAAYALLAAVLLLVPTAPNPTRRAWQLPVGAWPGLAAVPLLLVATALLLWRPEGLALARLDHAADERLIAIREGSHATVTVIGRGEHRLLRANNYYTLGGTTSLESERNRTLIPLLTHPDPRRVFYLGMGTGITAGAALRFAVERVDVCELLPEVVELAQRHFTPWNQGLFSDARVSVRAQDGHHCLRHATSPYDVIISDLFTPWKAGTGNLYTLEHYRMARARLAPGGLFVQWLPLYQLTAQEFGSIARTMQAAFPQVLMWRGDLFPDGSIVALVGTEAGLRLDPTTLVAHGRRLAADPALPAPLLEAIALRLYAGNLSATDLFERFPLNTRDRPVIEYSAPRSQRQVHAGTARRMLGVELGGLYQSLAEQVPPTADPYLARLDARAQGYVTAGLHYYHYRVLQRLGREALAQRHLERFLALTPFTASPPLAQGQPSGSDWDETRR